MKTRTRAARLGALLVLAALMATPLASAGYQSFGEVVDGSTTNADITPFLLVSPAVAAGAEVKFDDINSDGAVGTGEGVYIDSDNSGTITPLDIRIRASTGTTGTTGAQVKTSDNDCCNTPLVAVPAGNPWMFVDYVPFGALDGVINFGDPVFLDLDNDGQVSTSDIKVTTRGTASATNPVPTTPSAGSYANVAASDPNINNALTAVPAFLLNVFDRNGDGNYGFGDQMFLDFAPSYMAGPGDIRLNDATGSKGTMPKAGDKDTVHYLTAFGDPATLLKFQDADANTVPSASEGIYLDMDADNLVSVNDLRFDGASGTDGKQVKTGDGDIGGTLTALPGGLKYRDNNANSAFDADDHLYIELDGDGTVEVGDYRLARGTTTTGFSQGQRVVATSNDLGANLVALTGCAAGCVAFYDFAGGGAYNIHDVLYLDIDGDTLITPGDVRLQAGTSPLSTYGEIVTDAESEMEYCFDLDLTGGTLAYVEESNAGSLDLDEPVYFDRAGNGRVSALDVRITSDAGTAGSFVASGSNDQSSNVVAIAGTLVSYFDANGDGVYSAKGTSTTADTVYIDADGSGTITVRDIRITRPHTGTGAVGSHVTTSAPSSELNNALVSFGANAFYAVDGDGDGSFGTDDALYFNVDTALEAARTLPNCVTAGDVRMSGSSSSTGGGGGGGGGGGSTPTQPTQPTQPTTPTEPTEPTEPTGPTTDDVADANRAISSSLEATLVDGGGVRLSWDAQAGAAGYQVWRAVDDDYTYLALINDGDQESYTDVEGNESHAYLVTAFFSASGGGFIGFTQDIDSEGVPGGADLLPARPSGGEEPTEPTGGGGNGAPGLGIPLLLAALAFAAVALRRR